MDRTINDSLMRHLFTISSSFFRNKSNQTKSTETSRFDQNYMIRRKNIKLKHFNKT